MKNKLEVILDQLKKDDMVTDWIDYYVSARKHGISRQRVLEKIEFCVNDIYGLKYSKIIMEKFKGKLK